jgi:hypothetical protein
VVNGRLIDWWRRRRWTTPRIDRVETYPSQGDLPAKLDRHVLAVVGSREQPKWAVFECPCGQGHQLSINLSPARPPTWRLSETSAGPSLTPSVDSNLGRRCHFWLRHGRVHWTPDSTR